MSQKRHTPEQIINKLRQADAQRRIRFGAGPSRMSRHWPASRCGYALSYSSGRSCMHSASAQANLAD